MPRIFCAEGGYSTRLTDTTSVLPLLTFMQGIGKIKHVHRYVETRESLEKLLRRWTQKQYASFSLGYLGFHGSPGTLHVGQDKVSLVELGKLLEDKCADKTIYFGSCSVLDSNPDDLASFVRQTGVKAIAGYTKDVDWFESAAFDLLLFSTLTGYQRLPYAEDYLRKEYPDLTDRLGFKMVHRAHL